MRILEKNELKGKKEDTLAGIRQALKFDTKVLGQLKYYAFNSIESFENYSKEHRRFDMTGYDNGDVGSCTTHNQGILNTFAHLGIYDYTKYLCIDFYKGHGELHFRYWDSEDDVTYEFDNIGTVEIIYEIFELTIFSDKPKRRR